MAPAGSGPLRKSTRHFIGYEATATASVFEYLAARTPRGMKVSEQDYVRALAYPKTKLSKPQPEVERWLNSIVDAWIARRKGEGRWADVSDADAREVHQAQPQEVQASVRAIPLYEHSEWLSISRT